MSSVKGVAELHRRLEALGDTRPLMRTLQIAAVAEMQRDAPRKTVFHQRNIVPGRLTDDVAVVEARAPYAAALEFGSRPHVIEPKRAKVLAWGGQRRLSGRLRSGSKPTNFARRVMHPGTRAQPHLIPGARRALATVLDFLTRRWNEAA